LKKKTLSVVRGEKGKERTLLTSTARHMADRDQTHNSEGLSKGAIISLSRGREKKKKKKRERRENSPAASSTLDPAVDASFNLIVERGAARSSSLQRERRKEK